MNRLEQKSHALVFEGKRLEPVSLEKNAVGLCSRCESDLTSLSYHRDESSWLVCAQCKNDHTILMRYDQKWNWQGDRELQISPDEMSISSIDKEKLESVFTPAEIRDMLSCEQGLPYVRQNLYRARAKYDKFEKLFGLKLNL
jgi:hypothetical protein